MGRVNASRPQRVEPWTPSLLLAGGGLLVGHAAMLAVQAFSTLSTPPDVFGPAGHLLAIAGLLGLYRGFGDRMPIPTRIAATVGILALVGWGLMTVTRLLAVVGVGPSAAGVVPGALFLLVFAATVLTYALFGALTVRDRGSWLASLLVGATGGLILVALVASAVADVTAAGGVVVGTGLALSVLALGYTLRSWQRPTDRAVPAGDVTGG